MSCHVTFCFPAHRYVNLSDIQLDIMDYIRPADCKAEDFRGMWAEFEWENKVRLFLLLQHLHSFLTPHRNVLTHLISYKLGSNQHEHPRFEGVREPYSREHEYDLPHTLKRQWHGKTDCLTVTFSSIQHTLWVPHFTVKFRIICTILTLHTLFHVSRIYSSLCIPQTIVGTNFLAANLYARSVFGEDALVNVSVDRKEDGEGKLSGYIRIRSKTQGIALSLGDRITSVQRAATVPEAQAQ